ncbi:hypothetical protein KC333_g6745 [Hortaea werneckii]|nr:hypothetical protein KC333_g6745 [Hortaea werneckii]KAI7310540.1 hypothetical protein KC326_g6648 [Hortaea werneckii]
MTDPTAGITTAITNIVSAQLDAVETASSNPIKATYGGELYNFLIIDPDLVNNNFAFNYAKACSEAEFAESALSDDLEGNLDPEGYLVLPTLRDVYNPGNLDRNVASTLRKQGRTPKRAIITHPDDAAKDIIKTVLAAQFHLSDGLIRHALEHTHKNLNLDMHGFRTFMGNQIKQLKGCVFTFLTKRLQVLINRCGGPEFWLEAGYEARQEIFYDYIHEYPGHITMNVFSHLKSAFPYAQIWGVQQVDNMVHEFRRLFVYQIAELLEDTFNFAITNEACNVAKTRRGESLQSMCLAGRNKYVASIGIPRDFMDYPVRPLGSASSEQTMTKIDQKSPDSRKRKGYNPAEEMPTVAPRRRRRT